MDYEADLDRIPVPPIWAGMEKELEDGSKVWACGACPSPDACVERTKCIRAIQLRVE